VPQSRRHAYTFEGSRPFAVLIWGILSLAVVASPVLGESASSGSSSEIPERHAPETQALPTYAASMSRR
jgi:hypothetical protein